MRIDLGTVRESPFVGIFSLATEKIVFVPKTISKKEENRITDIFGIEVVKASIANSSLLGVFAEGNSKGIVAGSVLEENELQELRQMGIKAQKIAGITAVGNLLAVNDKKGVCSNIFSKQQVNDIEKFLGIELMHAAINGSDVVGASVVATNSGLVINKTARPEEMKKICDHFGMQGAAATANAGDCFIANSLVANSGSAIAGMMTTGFELARIDDGLRGE